MSKCRCRESLHFYFRACAGTVSGSDCGRGMWEATLDLAEESSRVLTGSRGNVFVHTSVLYRCLRAANRVRHWQSRWNEAYGSIEREAGRPDYQQPVQSFDHEQITALHLNSRILTRPSDVPVFS